MEDSKFQHIITTHSDDGESIFTTLDKHPKFNTSPNGGLTYHYATPDLPVDLSHNAKDDLNFSAECSQSGPASMDHRIVPHNGVAAAILVLQPGAITPMHRTRTVDMGIVLDGEIELILDGGEKRVLKQGDTFVQRGTMHEWRNASDKNFRMYAVMLDAKPILDAGGHELEEAGV